MAQPAAGVAVRPARHPPCGPRLEQRGQAHPVLLEPAAELVEPLALLVIEQGLADRRQLGRHGAREGLAGRLPFGVVGSRPAMVGHQGVDQRLQLQALAAGGRVGGGG